MPVAVSLAELVKTPGTLHLWPEKFVALMAKVEEEITQTARDVTTAWAVITDWCKEHDEDELAGAFFWLHKRKEIRPLRNRLRHISKDAVEWAFSSLPAAVSATGDVPGDVSTLAGAVAVLAERLRRVREAIS